MPTNQQIVIPAPTGVNITDESLETSANSAQQIAGLLCDRLGKIRSDINQVNACDLSLVAAEDNVEPSSGLLYYIGQQVVSGTDIYGNPQNVTFPNVGTDFLLILIGQSLYTAQYQPGSYAPSLTTLIPFAPQYPYQFQQPLAITDGPNGNFLSTPSRIRGAQYANEMVIVQDGSTTLNYRYYSTCDTNDPFASTTHIRTLGLPTPPALVLGADINYNSPSGGHVARTGTPSYSVVYLDEFGRQSSPSIPVQLDFTAGNAGDNALISFTYTNPASYLAVSVVQVYEYVTGNANAYLIYEQALTTGTNTITYEDGPTGTTDTTIEQGAVGPTLGENDPPNPASICWQYLDRMCLNDNTNPDTLQISNAGSPTQFNLIGYNPNAPNPADGIRAPVNSDNGDPIVGGASFGTFSVVIKTRGLYYLYGQNSSNFQIQQVGGAVGCVAKDSIQVLSNGTIFYLYSDGVYAFDGSTSTKISHQLDKAILAYDSLTLSQAQSKYINRRYWLNIGTDNWIFDQDANGGQGDWIYFAYGITALEFVQQQYGINPGQSYVGTVAQVAIDVVPQPSSLLFNPPCQVIAWDPAPSASQTLESYTQWVKHPDSSPPFTGSGSLQFNAVTSGFDDRGFGSIIDGAYIYYYNVTPDSTDYDVIASIKQTSLAIFEVAQYEGPCIRMSTSDETFYAALMTPNWNGGPNPTIGLYKFVGGVQTTLFGPAPIPNGSGGPQPWVNIWISAKSDTISVYCQAASFGTLPTGRWYRIGSYTDASPIPGPGFGGYYDFPNNSLSFFAAMNFMGHSVCEGSSDTNTIVAGTGALVTVTGGSADLVIA